MFKRRNNPKSHIKKNLSTPKHVLSATIGNPKVEQQKEVANIETEKQKPVISAVTFVGNKAMQDADVNTMFVQPYMMSQVTNLSNSIMMDHQKSIYLDENCNNDDKMKFMTWASYNVRAALASLASQITSYIIQNCTDLIVSTILRFNNEALQIGTKKSSECFGVANMVSPNDIYSELINVVPSKVYSMCEYIEVFVDGSRAFFEFNILMDDILSHIVARILNMYIIDITTSLGENGEIENLYRMLFFKCYNAQCTTLPSIADQYAFVTSIMRNMMEEYITELRGAFAMIAQTSANMLINSATVYARNYENIDYTTSTMMKDIPQLTSLFDDNNVVNKIIDGK